jgi:PPOX class probable F420-dependent enzyme
MTFTMTRSERESFLAEVHVGILGIEASGRAPVLVPIWYSYEPGGEITFLTYKESRKVKLLQNAGRFSLCVQSEIRPYRYVSVEGLIISLEEADNERDLIPIARRYLGREKGDEYVDATKVDERLIIRMRPKRWSSADYGKEDR